ncbi:MAG: YhjD/YihY/BrkB family envelope integrity protein [Candidatus Nanopelagicales bacterium]
MSAAPPPIAGTPIDPAPKEVPAWAGRLDETTIGGIVYRALRRYSYANVGLLAAGTAYFLLLALLSLLALGYGVAAIVGSDELAKTLTEALSNALPELVGEKGIDPEQLRSTGRTAGLVGLVLLLYAGLGAVNGAGKAMHLILGAPPDPRAFPAAKARQLVTLLMIVPLVVVSFASASLTSSLLRPAFEALSIDGGPIPALFRVLGLLVGFAVDVLILWLLLGRLGGIAPNPRPRLTASLIGAVVVGVIKQLLSLIVAWSLDKPQYGAFAAPIAALFVLSLLSNVLYATAAVAAAISDADVPLEDLEPTPVEPMDADAY